MVRRRDLGGLIAAVGVILALAGPARATYECDAAVNRTSVPQGGEIMLTVSTRGDMGWSADFDLPAIPGVRTYAGGTNQSMSMVNGRTETSVSRTYFLRVETDADFTIPAVTIHAGGATCSTEPIAITVTQAAAGANALPPAQTGNRTARPDPEPAAGAGGAAGQPGDDIFVTLTADHDKAWVGQQVVVTFSYWRRVQPWNNPSYTPPRTEGFWREDLGEKNARRVVRGRAYNVTEIRYAVFPTRAGALTIEPAELSFPAGVFDRFFQSQRSRTGPRVLRTEPLTITVQELPRPAPDGYSGLVATSLDLVSVVDRDTVPRGEAIGLQVRLTADGFLKGFSELPVPVPVGARLHDAGENYRTAIDRDRLVGHIAVEKVIVPDLEGALEVPAVALTWFDAADGRYRTSHTEPWRVTVLPSDRPRPSEDESGFLRSEIARLGEDLAFIHQVPRSLSRRSGTWTGGRLWWGLLLLPVALLGGFRLLLARWAAARRDPAGRRRRGALAAALARLAPEAAPSPDDVARAICGYVADCHDRPLASVGPEQVQAHCRALDDAAAARRLTGILAACDAARFGGAGGTALVDLARDAAEVLRRVDRARGQVGGAMPRLAILLLALLLAGLAGPAGAGDDRPGADPARLLAEGNQAYTEGRLDDAAALYLEAREAGVNDPVLHFNLGNTYARRGELGRAVASYLRAERLAPRDRDVAANLQWVRRHIRDLELNEGSLPLFIAQFVALVQAFTLDQWGLLTVVLAWLVAGLVAWGWYRDGFGERHRRLLLAGAGVLVVVVAITTARWYDEQGRDEAVVVADEVAVRSGPSRDFSTLFEVHDGLTLNIVGRREGWVRVGMGGDWEGWVPAESVEPVRLELSPQGR